MPFARDTSREARRRVIEALRSKTGQERLHMAASATAAAWHAMRAGVAHAHPGGSEEFVHRDLLRRWLGRELGDRVFEAWRARRPGTVH